MYTVCNGVQCGVILPVVYDDSIQWEQWLLLYEAAADMNHWTHNPTKMANMLIFSLRGRALSLCLTFEEEVRTDYTALKDKLTEVLCPKSKWKLSLTYTLYTTSYAKCIRQWLLSHWRSLWEEEDHSFTTSLTEADHIQLPKRKVKRRARRKMRKTY